MVVIGWSLDREDIEEHVALEAFMESARPDTVSPRGGFDAFGEQWPEGHRRHPEHLAKWWQ